MDMSKYRGMFLSETQEHLQSMGRLVVTLENNPSDREGIDSLFRAAHSIKGMAASMGYEQTAQLAHHLEDLLDDFRKKGSVPAMIFDRLLAGIDLLEGLLEDIAAEQPEREVNSYLSAFAAPDDPAENEPAPTPVASEPTSATLPATPSLPVAGQTLQVRVELTADAAAPAARALLLLREMEVLGKLLESTPAVEELRRGGPLRRLEAWLSTEQTAGQVQEILAAMADVKRVSVAGGRQREGSRPSQKEGAGRTVRMRTELLDRFIDLTGELITNRYMLQTAFQQERWRDAGDALNQLRRLITDLHHHVLQVRMMPLESITGRIPRLVRELCRKSGKEVELRISGEDVELDRTILEELSDPVVHMVRNAVDHGIEKSGAVSVRAWREKDLALLEVADDGRDMDPQAILRKALAKGLVSPEQAKAMADRDILQLVCRPGFSTTAEITETSGRGVGMDVVKTAVENLGGILEIQSELGRGTHFLLKLPLSIAIIQILLVECAGHTIGIPITRVLRTLEISRSEVRSSGRQLSIPFDEEIVPLLSLRKILQLPVYPSRSNQPVVIPEGRRRKVGLVVDRLVGQREVFVKTLASPLDRLPGLSGATVLGDGSVIFIIDPQSLLEQRPGASAARPRGGNL
jgi:two-component system chemotaxis sensor kinase CheA